MKIAYVLDRPELGGGVKVVFQHAALLAGRGHTVYVCGRGAEPAWTAGVAGAGGARPSYLDLSHQPPDAPPDLPEPVDLALATYWTTLVPVRRSTARAAAHLCQGFEPDWPHQRHDAERIQAAYREAALPALVVSPHLGERLAERFDLPWRLAPPPVDPRFRPARRWGPRRRPWIAVQGIFQAEVKGVPTALQAVRRLEQEGLRPRLLRISVLPPTEEEGRLRRADRYLQGVPPSRVARELRRCDLALFPARPGEGFGLPLLEAMASGVPAVASRLPSTERISPGAVPLVAPDDGEAFAREARRLLQDTAAWRSARRGVLREAAAFLPERVAAVLDEAVRWAREAGEGEGGGMDSDDVEDGGMDSGGMESGGMEDGGMGGGPR